VAQISIPSSEDEHVRAWTPPPPRNWFTRNWFKWGLSAGLIAVVIAFAVIDRPTPDPPDAPPSAVASPSNALGANDVPQHPPVVVEATGFPGTGTVTAIIDEGAVLSVFVAESYSGTAVWQSELGVSAWHIVDQFPGVDIIDAVSFDGAVVAVGVYSASRQGVVLSGELGSMTEIDVALDRLETPHRVSVAGNEAFVLTRRGEPSLADLAGRLFRTSDGVRFEAEVVGPSAHGADSVVIRDGRVLAYGRAGSNPAGWDISKAGDPQRLDIDLGDVEGSIRAAAVSPAGDLVGLVSDALGFRIPETAVYNLEPPFEQLTAPVPGMWDRLVVDGETLVALPVAGTRTTVTVDGRLWSLREERFDPLDIGLTPQSSEQSHLPLQIVAYSATTDRVVIGGSGGPGGNVPIVGSLRDVGRAFDMPSDAWTMLDDLDGGVLVQHFGGIQIGLLNDVVVTRETFGEPWTQPVFAGEPSVGAVTDVIETELGFLIMAHRPVPLLWFSRTGNAWEPIARDVVGVAAHDGEILIVAATTDGLTVTSISDGVVEQIDSNLTELGGIGPEMGWVDGLGYVTGPVDGALLVSPDGARWTIVQPPIRVDEIAMSAGRLGILERPASWMGYRWKAEMFESANLPNLAEVEYQIFVHRDLITILGSTGSYVSRDSVDWLEVSTGVWEGVDGLVYDLWLLDDEVIGLIGDAGHQALYRRPMTWVTSTR
jgi:hypothetical protein